ncbi:MAG: hypothetical protein JNG84_11430 [Archangium sp.]|nr:hypothetical protein [Archangium sp.]
MPIAYETKTLPTGLRAAVLTSTGSLDATDARDYASRMGPSAPDFELPVLMLSRGSLDISPEARSIFTSKTIADRPGRMAIVIDSVPVRVLVNFLMRMSKGNDRVRLFHDEAGAVAWLSEQVAP